MKHFLAVFGFRFNYTYTIAAFCFSVFAVLQLRLSQSRLQPHHRFPAMCAAWVPRCQWQGHFRAKNGSSLGCHRGRLEVARGSLLHGGSHAQPATVFPSRCQQWQCHRQGHQRARGSLPDRSPTPVGGPLWRPPSTRWQAGRWPAGPVWPV